VNRRAKDCDGQRKHSHCDNPYRPTTISSGSAFRFRRARSLAGQTQASREILAWKNEAALRDACRVSAALGMATTSLRDRYSLLEAGDDYVGARDVKG